MFLLLFTGPSYFALEDIFGSILGFVGYASIGYTIGSILSIVCYVSGVVFLLFVMSFVSSAFKKYPELRRLIPGAGSNQDAWQGAFAAAAFFAIAASIHFVFITIFGAEGIIAVMAKLAVFVFLLFGASMATTALDGFVVKPILASLSSDEADRDALRRVRKIGTAIFLTITVLAGLATIIDVAFK